MPVYKIRSCYPVSGDWYCVTEDHQENRRYIDRVVMWAQVEAEDQVDHVRAITSDGMPHEHYNESSDQLFVYGPDLSPGGKTWNELYLTATQNEALSRELPQGWATAPTTHRPGGPSMGGPSRSPKNQLGR